MKLLEIKQSVFDEWIDSLEKQVFEKNKLIDQMKEKFETSLGEAMNEIALKSSQLKSKSDDLKKMKHKYVWNQHDWTHDVEKMAV